MQPFDLCKAIFVTLSGLMLYAYVFNDEIANRCTAGSGPRLTFFLYLSNVVVEAALFC